MGTGFPLSSCQTIRTTALRRGTLTFCTLRSAWKWQCRPPTMAKVFCHQPCNPSRSSEALIRLPSLFGPPLGSKEKPGRISSRGEAGFQPGGKSPPSEEPARFGGSASSGNEARVARMTNPTNHRGRLNGGFMCISWHEWEHEGCHVV